MLTLYQQFFLILLLRLITFLYIFLVFSAHTVISSVNSGGFIFPFKSFYFALLSFCSSWNYSRIILNISGQASIFVSLPNSARAFRISSPVMFMVGFLNVRYHNILRKVFCNPSFQKNKKNKK